MESAKIKPRLTPHQARPKIEKYCSYQERSQWQVRKKLMDYGLSAVDADMMLVDLLRDNFINEERFTRAFVFGKFKTKGWGKKKIQQGLKAVGVNEKLIQKVLLELPAEDYSDKLETIAKKKWRLIKGPTLYERQVKLQRFLLGRGYDMDAVVSIAKQISASSTDE
jgi:regulatory protein